MIRNDGMIPPHFESRILNRSHVPFSIAFCASDKLHSDSSSIKGTPIFPRSGANPSGPMARLSGA